VQFQNTDHVK